MHIVLFEDHLTGENRPVTLSRPAFGVGCAGTRLYDVAKRHADGVSAIVRAYLRPRTEAEFALAPMATRDVLLVNAALVPSFAILGRLGAMARERESYLIQDGARVAAAYFAELPEEVKRQDECTITSFLLAQPYRAVREDLPLITYPFDLIRYHEPHFAANVGHLHDGLEEVRLGVFVGKDVKIHPTTVFDTDEGPVILHDGVTIMPFGLLIGPVIVGRGTKLTERASLKEAVQIGTTCKIGGEVECAVVEPYTNKQHHGFLGHSYVGSWVNMGAGTSNSDLKNTYGEIAVQHRGQRLETGMQFLGCVIGDYSKTAINTSIFTGKIIGVSSYLYGFVGTNVPSFTNYARSFGQETECRLDAAVRTQQRMFKRRKIEQTPADIKLLEDLFEITRDERLMSTDPLAF